MGAPAGNTNASRGALIRAEIKDALERRDRRAGKLEGYSLRELFDVYVSDAFEDKETRKDLLDRMYGKPKQAVDLGNADNEPFRHIAWPLPKTTLDQ